MESAALYNVWGGIMIGTIWRAGNLGLAFAVELAAIAALAYWGFRVGGSPLERIVLGIGAPAAAIVLWALFAAPKSTFSVPGMYWVVAVLMFGGAGLALWTTGHHVLGVLLPAVFVVNLLIIKVMHLAPAN
ncbi:MAG TPA: YrdB family protein [Sporichthyaceae bacterium]|jgi:hypothetical protein|nr:YrdB family protein [Sporichthyaceae bacterium]